MDEYGYTDKKLVDKVNELIDKINELNAQMQYKTESKENYQQGYDTANEEWLNRMDKMRAEIEGIIQEETVNDYSGGEYERIISKVDPDDVLEIIDKYRKKLEKKYENKIID